MSSSRSHSWLPRLSLLFLAAGILVILTYQLLVSLDQSKNLADTRQSFLVAVREQQGQLSQVEKEKTRVQNLTLELLDLAKTSDLARVIADKYNIRRNPAAVGASNAPDSP